MGRFTNPRDLYFGEGARHEVKNLKGERAVIVTGGGSMRRGGFLQDVENDLKEAGFEVKLIEGVESDPSVETVMNGAAVMSEFQPDWIIALGGGSPIDAAKAMWIKYEYPETTFEDMCKVFGLPKLRTKAHFCAISSTSGTATEVTAFSIITDYSKGIKFPIADFEITPDVAIVDPELTYTMPAKLCAHTGMDALTHSIEAYVSTAGSAYTDANALYAMREIVEWLPKSYQGDKEARQHMHDAQCIAGIAFSSGLRTPAPRAATPTSPRRSSTSPARPRTSSSPRSFASRTTARAASRPTSPSSTTPSSRRRRAASPSTPSATPAPAPTRASPRPRRWRSSSSASTTTWTLTSKSR